MIREHLIPKINTAFPGWDMKVSHKGNPIVSFPEAQEEVGGLDINDDGDEASVFIEHISHGHFGCYEMALRRDEREAIIAEDIVDFLKLLFSEKVLLFKSKNFIGAGGWSIIGVDSPVQLRSGYEYYLWSKIFIK